jgi:CubicO group peptidase (beta-lactamase class C family)
LEEGVLQVSEKALMRSSPEQQGIRSSGIIRFLEAIEAGEQEIHSFMLLRNGYVVAEGWWSPYVPELPHMMFSLSKSFTSTAVGMAVEEGFFSLEDAVISFFPEDIPQGTTDYWAALRLHHLLSMSTGHDLKPFPFMYEQQDGNWVKGFFEVPLVHEPGSHFLYNTGASYMLSEIVRRSTGMNLIDFLTPRLFEPLGIEGAKWDESPTGVSLGGIGLSIKTEDIARFGQLYLQKGLWQGQRILSEAWIAEATKAQVSNGYNPKSDWTQGYGYQFWRCQHGFYRGDGSFGQFCIVMEQYNAVFAMTAAAKDMQAVMNTIWEFLVPAFQAAPLAEDRKTHERLLQKLSQLQHAPVQGLPGSQTAAKVSGKSYLVESNDLGIESLSLDFSENACTLRLKTKAGDESIRAAYGDWCRGQASIFDEIWLSGSQALVASGAWLDENHYMMMMRLYESPYVYTLNFHFEGAMLMIHLAINVSLLSRDAQVMKARRIL